MAKVYVSSTYQDLQEHRDKVRAVLRRMGHEDVAMEYYVAGDQRPVDKCLADVAACDVYVGIFAWRYGWVPTRDNPDKLAITEMEYRRAFETHKPCLIFLLSEDAPWPPKFIDRDRTQIERLRNGLSEEHSRQPFNSPDELGRLVAEAIHNWEKEHGQLMPLMLFPEFDLKAYYEALTKRYQRLDLDALTPPQKEEYLRLQLRTVFVEQSVRENPPPVELTKELWERLQREKEIHPDDLPANVTLDDVLSARTAYYEKPSRPVLDVITDARHRHTIILGDPGSGKSTLARYALLSLIAGTGDEKLSRTFEGYLPLLIELRSYAALHTEDKCDTFLEFLDYMGETEGWHLNKDKLHHYLKTDGRAVVIFDGLDEIFEPEARERVALRIAGFASDYPQARVIVTSRVIGYRRKMLEDAGFAHFTLQDLNEEQVSAFVNQWYSLALSDRPDEAESRRERIMRSFQKSPSIRQLAGNPMLLTIMAIIGKHQELPKERWKLYDHAASVLIQHWDINKHLHDRKLTSDLIEEEDKKELLRRLAYRMQSGERGLAGNAIHRDQLQEEFEGYLKERYGQTTVDAARTARAIIEQFRERNFILSLYGANVYGFVHRAFLEYFCATAFVNKFEKTRDMDIGQLKRDVYGAHYEDRSWHEVLRLICGMIDEKFAGELIDYLVQDLSKPWSEYSIKQPPWNIALAVQCLSELRNPGTVAEPAQRVLQTVCALLEADLVREGIPEFSGFFEEEISASIEGIGSNWPNRHILIGWLKAIKPSTTAWLDDERFGSFIGSIGKGMDGIYRTIMDYAMHADEKYRVLAPFALAIGWHDTRQTLPLLRDRAVNDENHLVVSAAVQAIAKHFRSDPQTLPLIHDRVVNDKSGFVRFKAVEAIATHFRDDPQTLPLLQKCAKNDPYGWVRSRAKQLAHELRAEQSG